jgi:hypothetical protein
MLARLSAIEYVRAMRSGRSGPLLLLCESADGQASEIVVKISAGCDEGVINLAREMVAACLATDLGLPIPPPYVIDFAPEFTSAITDSDQRNRVQNSSPVAFGSHHITGQYSAWMRGQRLSHVMIPSAAAILVFDGIIQNPDRRADNPNCLTRGDEIRIFDHEMTFTHKLVLGWLAPWRIGGLKNLETPGAHIFREQLRRRQIDYGPIRAAWAALSDPRLTAYGAAVPTEWAAANDAVRLALELIRGARDNIDARLTEVQRILR